MASIKCTTEWFIRKVGFFRNWNKKINENDDFFRKDENTPKKNLNLKKPLKFFPESNWKNNDILSKRCEYIKQIHIQYDTSQPNDRIFHGLIWCCGMRCAFVYDHLVCDCIVCEVNKRLMTLLCIAVIDYI